MNILQIAKVCKEGRGTMIYEGNEQLVKEYKKVLIEAGVTVQGIAEAVGISRQSVHSILRKQHLGFDDLERLLAPMGYGIEFRFVKK